MIFSTLNAENVDPFRDVMNLASEMKENDIKEYKILEIAKDNNTNRLTYLRGRMDAFEDLIWVLNYKIGMPSHDIRELHYFMKHLD